MQDGFLVGKPGVWYFVYQLGLPVSGLDFPLQSLYLGIAQVGEQ